MASPRNHAGSPGAPVVRGARTSRARFRAAACGDPYRVGSGGDGRVEDDLGEGAAAAVLPQDGGAA